MSAGDRPVVLSARGVGKRYGDAVVLDGVDIDVRAGTVHGLVGRNGAGKSTLVGILTGRHGADGGEVRIDGRAVSFGSPHAAAEAGVAAVPQEIILPMTMTVQEAITLGAEPNRRGVVRRKAERARVQEILASLEADLDPEMRVADLPVSSQKIVLVAQVLHRNARVIALDEPTSAMNAEDAGRVQRLVEVLRDRGVAVLYISHRFEEVERLCDEVTVLRDGRLAAHVSGPEVRQGRLIDLMMGDVAPERRTHANGRQRREGAADGDVLQMDSVSSGILEELTLKVRAGEIVGLAGLPGSGVEQVFGVLSGQSRIDSGRLSVNGSSIDSVRSAIQAGISFLPASRKAVVMEDEGVVENMVLGALRRAAGAGVFITRPRVRRFCTPTATRLSLQPVLGRKIGQLSGGNQQRALVAGRLLANPRFLVLEDPTVGVDIAARSELHDLLHELADQGLGAIVGSTDTEELAELCDRVVVIRSGRAVADFEGDAATDLAITEAMTAVTRRSTAAA